MKFLYFLIQTFSEGGGDIRQFIVVSGVYTEPSRELYADVLCRKWKLCREMDLIPSWCCLILVSSNYSNIYTLKFIQPNPMCYRLFTQIFCIFHFCYIVLFYIEIKILVFYIILSDFISIKQRLRNCVNMPTSSLSITILEMVLQVNWSSLVH